MRKLLVMLSSLALTFTLAACSDQNTEGGSTSLEAIDVVSREDGSGTRSAFEEIIDFNQKGDDDEIVDPITSNANIKDGNGVVATHVAGNDASLGYVSFVTLAENEGKVKGLTVEGVEPTVENVLSGDYGVARPFNMVYLEENLTDVEKAFVAFIESTEGAEIIEEEGGIANMEGRESFDSSAYDALTGNLVLGGSTSVEGVAKAVAGEFTALFPNVTYTYDATGSSAGVENAINGTYTLGFASRSIKDTELAQGITADVLCMDGIALVVNPSNETTNISMSQIKDVYTGSIANWSELAE